MATRTTVLGQFYGSNNQPNFTATLEWDDVNMRITRINVNNTSTRAYTVEAYCYSNSRRYTFTIQAGASISQVIPTNLTNRLDIAVTPSGRLTGVEWSIY